MEPSAIVNAEVTARRFIFVEIWDENRPIFKAILTDTLAFVSVIGVLSLVYVILQKTPYPSERKEIFETVHYYGYLIISVMFVVDLVLQLAGMMFRRGKNGTTS
jgi:hypothetical protein